MKKTIACILAILGLSPLAYLGIKGQDIQEIETKIEIAAPPDKVWRILVNIEDWQNWSPIIKRSKGKAEVGEALDITMVGGVDGEGPQYSPVITQLDAPRTLRWRAHMISEFMFTNDKVLELVATPEGSRLVHKEVFTGLLSPLFCGQMEEGVPPMLKVMNEALKKKAEL